jgi:hypothetical protein
MKYRSGSKYELSGTLKNDAFFIIAGLVVLIVSPFFDAKCLALQKILTNRCLLVGILASSRE